jgi:hypothetical protein
MRRSLSRDSQAEAFEKPTPRFSSYLGLFYVAVIFGILGFAGFHASGTGHAYDQLKLGMTPTEVAALLGVPRSESKSESRVVQMWRIPDGFTIEVEYQDGRLISKARRATGVEPR